MVACRIEDLTLGGSSKPATFAARSIQRPALCLASISRRVGERFTCRLAVVDINFLNSQETVQIAIVRGWIFFEFAIAADEKLFGRE